MPIRIVYMIVAATTLTVCPGPGPDGPGSSRPAERTGPPAATAGASPGATPRGYPPHAGPVTSRPPGADRHGEGSPGPYGERSPWPYGSRSPWPSGGAGDTPGHPPPPVYDHRYGASAPPGPAGPSPVAPASEPPSSAPPTGGGLSEPPGVTPSATGRATAAPDSRWGAPVLVENFDGTQIDRSRWEVYDSPGAAVNPRTARATTVHDGMLHMTGGFYDGKDLSGGVASRLTQSYGRWEVRFRGEKGAGYSLVTLLWPSSQAGEYAEIDFAEVIDPTRQTGGIYVHRGEAEQAQSLMRADFTRWHTVAVDWLPGRLTFWLDGRRTWDYTGPRVPSARPMHLTLQNDVVCNQWSPCRDSSTPGTVSMFVDWVRIFRAP